MNILIKTFRFIVSILLFPACVACTLSFYSGIMSIKTVSESGLVFILGALSYSVLHLLLFKLDLLYVFGHELMHAVAALFSGRKVIGMKVSTTEAGVRTTTPNLFVALAPYLLPGYTIFIALAYFLSSFFMDVTRFSGLFVFIAGFTLMFHLAYTAESIRSKQSDLLRSGYFFSMSLIYIVNLLIVFSIISLFFREASFYNFLSGSYERSKEFYFFFWRQLFL